MAPEANGPNISLPNVAALDSFLEGAGENNAPDYAEDTAVAADNAVEDVDTSEDLPAGDTFDRKYVEKLRKESASYRERAKKYEAVFEGYEDGAVDEWREMITNFKADPKSVAEQWKDLSGKILEQFTPAEQEVIEEALNDDETPLTMSQLQNILDTRQKDMELEKLVTDIEREASDLGYNLKSREYKVLLMTAQELRSGSITEAHELLQAEKQKVIDAFVAEQSKGADRHVPSGLAGVPNREKEIKSMKDAKEALTNFLDGQFK